MPLRLTQRWTPLEREQCRASLVILSQTLLYCNYSRVFIGKCILAYLWNSTKEHIHTGKQHTPCPSVSLKKLMIANSLNDQFCLPAIFQNKRATLFCSHKKSFEVYGQSSHSLRSMCFKVTLKQFWHFVQKHRAGGSTPLDLEDRFKLSA